MSKIIPVEQKSAYRLKSDPVYSWHGFHWWSQNYSMRSNQNTLRYPPPSPNRTYITVYGLPHKFLAVHHFVPDSQCGFKYILPYSLTLQSYEYIKLWPIYVQCMTVCLCKIRISYQCNFDYKWSRSEKLVLKKLNFYSCTLIRYWLKQY